MSVYVVIPLSVVLVAGIGLFVHLKGPRWIKRAYDLIVVFVVIASAYLLFYRCGYQRGYHAALDPQKARLIMHLDALDEIHAGNVEDATWDIEEASFGLTNQFLLDEQYQSDPQVQALMPRLTKYRDTYCDNRKKHTSTEVLFRNLLSPIR